MNTFLLELWSDLKEKRLWPVAALLLLALVAVPFVLAKPAEEPPAPVADPTVAPDPNADGPQVLPAELEAAKPLLQTTTLSEFASRDPFKPLKTLRKIEKAAGVEPTPADEATSPAETDDGAPGPDGGGGTEAPPVQQEKEVFTYQAVVDLGTASGTRTRKVNRLGILPSDTNPILVFLGVSADNNGEAVFLVDSTVSQAGEGRCRPSPSTCSFLYLTTEESNDEHIFTTDEGKEYSVKLIEIRRVKVRAVQSSAPEPVAQAGSAVPTTGVSALDATTEAVTAEPVEDPFEGFGFPLFADEEE